MSTNEEGNGSVSNPPPAPTGNGAGSNSADKLILPRSCVKRIMKLNGRYTYSIELFMYTFSLYFYPYIRLWTYELSEDVKVVSAVGVFASPNNDIFTPQKFLIP